MKNLSRTSIAFYVLGMVFLLESIFMGFGSVAGLMIAGVFFVAGYVIYRLDQE